MLVSHARARSRGRRAHGHCGPRVGRAFGKRSRCRGCPRARIRRRRLARPRGYRSRPGRTTGGLGRYRRGAAPRHERARRQVLRLPLRGRDREGHPPLGRGGLRLDRALQALHDHHDGSVPGPHVPAASRAADGEGDRHEHGRRGHHDRAPALARGADGRARRAAVRAGEALLDPRAPPPARRQRDVGGRLAPRLRLRRPEGRGHGGAQGRRTDRRVHARQADRARPGRRRVPRPPLPEPLLQPEARPHPLRRDHERLRARDGRRHHLPPRRRQLLRDHHVERRRRDLRLVHLVARRLAPRRAPHRRHAGTLRREPRGPARAGDHGQGHRARLLGRGLHLPRRQAGRGGGRAVA